jgi:hypothetical protein
MDPTPAGIGLTPACHPNPTDLFPHQYPAIETLFGYSIPSANNRGKSRHGTTCMDKNNQAGVATIKICACNYLTGRFTKKKLDLSGEYYAKDARVIVTRYKSN